MIILKRKKEEFFLIAEIGLVIYNAYAVSVFYHTQDLKAFIPAILITGYHCILTFGLLRDLLRKEKQQQIQKDIDKLIIKKIAFALLQDEKDKSQNVIMMKAESIFIVDDVII